MTVIFMSLITLFLTSYSWQQSKFLINESKVTERNIADQRQRYDEYIARLKRYRPSMEASELPQFEIKRPKNEN